MKMGSKSLPNLRRKLRSETGLTWLVYLLLVAVIVTFVLFIVVPGYERHNRNARITMDAESVATAKDVASVAYLQDGRAGLVIYYYDELHHSVLERDAIGTIEPYGRSAKEDNLHNETGAVGIPNENGEDTDVEKAVAEKNGTYIDYNDGPQLLAIAVSYEGTRNARWTGHKWRYLDYYYMLPAERETLTPSDFRAMDDDTVQRAVKEAKAAYKADYAKQLKDGKDPGTAVYGYSAIGDFVFYDEIMQQAENAAELPEGQEYGTAEKLNAYGFLNEAEGCVLQVTVTGAGEDAVYAWIPSKEH